MLIPVLLIVTCTLFDNPSLDVFNIDNNAGEGYKIIVMQTYPGDSIEHIIYVLDGDWNTTTVYDELLIYKENSLIIGIGYPDTTRRLFDYTPTSIEEYNSGGGDAFIGFINNKLIPFIDSIYSTAHIERKDRILLGHSLGGLFTLYMMYEANEHFKSFVSLSPAIDWDLHLINRVENDSYDDVSDDSLNLYIAIGGSESETFIRDFGILTEIIESRDNNMTVFVDIIGYRTHNSMVEPGINNAFELFREYHIF